MKFFTVTKFSLLCLVLICLSLFAFQVKKTEAAVRVRGYYKSTGAYVAPHYRSNPDGYKYNNYSTKGNYNIYTGKAGYKSW